MSILIEQNYLSLEEENSLKNKYKIIDLFAEIEGTIGRA